MTRLVVGGMHLNGKSQVTSSRSGHFRVTVLRARAGAVRLLPRRCRFGKTHRSCSH